jgi:hypothetical protein
LPRSGRWWGRRSTGVYAPAVETAQNVRTEAYGAVSHAPESSPMAPDDHPHDGRESDPLGHLQHTLKSPLTTLSGRAQLVARAIRRSPTLTEGERENLLLSVAAIEVAVQQLVTVIDGIRDWPL